MITIDLHKKFILAYTLIYIGFICLLIALVSDWQHLTYKDIPTMMFLILISASPWFVKINGWPFFTYLREATSPNMIINHHPGSIVIYQLENGRWHWYMLTDNFYEDLCFFDIIEKANSELLFILDSNDTVYNDISYIYVKDKEEVLQASILYALTIFNYKITWKNNELESIKDINDLLAIIEAYNKSVAKTKINNESK